ncbi:RICIN domain-containing protein [Aquabacterium sp. A7-Y]|uniref:RICIN domain-containing protein n=1 Tax=Aquabacterium sp. A7-Y TaxID=1349605 RepID=UPI00223E3B9F|nr:RICIN domain-containing protein [Aquabacterium sp. A7-Y]MCW7541175.1 RICIN domain-containing protein [Aquabacterium sp. A7-Y]
MTWHDRKETIMRATGNRKIAGAFLAAAAMAVVSAATAHAQASPTDGASILRAGDGKYGFMNLKSGKVLQPKGASTANGARIVQQPMVLSRGDLVNYQNWAAYNAGSNYFSFRNVKSGKALGVDRASTASGAELIQATADTNNNQDWKFQTHPNYPSGVYSIKNRKSGLCIGISGASTASGAQAAQFRCDGRTNQGWKVIDN